MKLSSDLKILGVLETTILEMQERASSIKYKHPKVTFISSLRKAVTSMRALKILEDKEIPSPIVIAAFEALNKFVHHTKLPCRCTSFMISFFSNFIDLFFAVLDGDTRRESK